jgi:hypothetical protein
MKILISWSGERSHAAALVLRDWLPVVLPFVETWVSSADIPKGRRWSVELAEQLDSTNCGILCVTPENVREPWLVFEAGALSKSLKEGQVHPFLLGMKGRELEGPLSQFQATELSKEDVGKLVRDINQAAGDKKLSTERLSKGFETCWPDLDGKLSSLNSGRQRVAPISSVKAGPAAVADLDDLQTAMLKLVAEAEEARLFPEKAADAIGMHPQRAKHVLETLEAAGLVTPSYNYLYGTSWVLNKAGRAELVRRRLL